MKWRILCCLVGLLLVVFFIGTRSTEAAQTATVQVTVDVGVCGDGIVGSSEDCDGANLNGGTCNSEGFASGTLDCLSSCDYDTSACVPGSNDSGNSGGGGGGSSGSNSSANSDSAANASSAASSSASTTAKAKTTSRTVTAPITDYTKISPTVLLAVPKQLFHLNQQDQPSKISDDVIAVLPGDVVSFPDSTSANEEFDVSGQALQVIGQATQVTPVIKSLIDDVAASTVAAEIIKPITIVFQPVHDVVVRNLGWFGLHGNAILSIFSLFLPFIGFF